MMLMIYGHVTKGMVIHTCGLSLGFHSFDAFEVGQYRNVNFLFEKQ